MKMDMPAVTTTTSNLKEEKRIERKKEINKITGFWTHTPKLDLSQDLKCIKNALIENKKEKEKLKEYETTEKLVDMLIDLLEDELENSDNLIDSKKFWMDNEEKVHIELELSRSMIRDESEFPITWKRDDNGRTRFKNILEKKLKENLIPGKLISLNTQFSTTVEVEIMFDL